MATTGVDYVLSEESKGYAIKYVEESGYYKNRLANFLGISRPTLYKVLEEDEDFFTALKRADAVYCKSLIDIVSKKDPVFILRTRYKEEFDDKNKFVYSSKWEIESNNKGLFTLPTLPIFNSLTPSNP
jgi:hypothetical protein